MESLHNATLKYCVVFAASRQSDWMFNLFCNQHGFIAAVLTIYQRINCLMCVNSVSCKHLL